MRATIEITHSCGCSCDHAIQWDGRRKKIREYLTPSEAARHGLRHEPMPDGTELTPRLWAQILVERAHPPAKPCLACITAARREILWIACWWDRPAKLRALRRVQAIIGGEVTRSPKSMHSLYCTGLRIAWRISDHPWPGRPDSLISERAVGRYWVARLHPDWLARETEALQDVCEQAQCNLADCEILEELEFTEQ